ncbi:uncharacterized protein V6R79_017538 [Siganus canaliculatus]
MIHNVVNNRCIKQQFCSLLATAFSQRLHDLSGKMFTFPQESNTAYVRLTTTKDTFSAATVCLRSMTDLSRDHAIFSLATPSRDNALLIFWEAAKDAFSFNVQNNNVKFGRQDYTPNVWHSICTTWDSETGVAQLWLDGKPSVRKFVATSSINEPIVILAQDQDSYGGTFDKNQSFVGMISDVHMWDNVLSPCEIQHYVDDPSFTPGNALNWRKLEFQISGTVLVEEAQLFCL